MSILSSLTLSDATKRTENTDPKANLRRKMAAALDQQIAGANAEIAGQHYAVEVEKWFTTDPATGTKERRKVQKVFRRMWFKDGTDRVMLELRFAGKPLLIAGKSSIVVGTVDQIVPTLQTVKKAVLAGELDAALKAALDSRKRTLKQKTATAAAPAPKAGK